jgi:tungstate transport system substrate-binding protein
MRNLQRAAVATALVPLVACGSSGAGPAADDEADGDVEEDVAGRTIVLATTTSTQDSGLLDELIAEFTDETGARVQTIAVGSGQAIELARRGEADVALVHSPAAEEELVAEGDTGRRLLVMHNDFVLLGPDGDPAGLAGTPVDEAFAAIAAAGAPFVSRGDESGTHAKELGLWEDAGAAAEGDWYTSTGQGMGATLRVASERGAYALSDRATYLSQRDTLALEVLVEGDPGLLNVYHVIEMTTEAGDRVEEDAAVVFADWIVSDEVQKTIGDFGVEEFGEPLFVPDAGKDEDDLTG